MNNWEQLVHGSCVSKHWQPCNKGFRLLDICTKTKAQDKLTQRGSVLFFETGQESNSHPLRCLHGRLIVHRVSRSSSSLLAVGELELGKRRRSGPEASEVQGNRMWAGEDWR